jgi:hypothetical protein
MAATLASTETSECKRFSLPKVRVEATSDPAEVPTTRSAASKRTPLAASV